MRVMAQQTPQTRALLSGALKRAARHNGHQANSIFVITLFVTMYVIASRSRLHISQSDARLIPKQFCPQEDEAKLVENGLKARYRRRKSIGGKHIFNSDLNPHRL